MSKQDPPSTIAQAIAHLLRPEKGPTATWTAAELQSVLVHQLSAPLAVDLGSGAQVAAEALDDPDGPPLETFGQLLQHPAPPVALLELAKSFFKTRRHTLRHELPVEVYTVLYYACIAAGMARCRLRLTALSDADLQQGLNWSAAREWLPESLRGLFNAALHTLHEAPSSDSNEA